MATHATCMSKAVAAWRRAGTAVALIAVVTLWAAAPVQAAPGSDTTVVETTFRPGAGASQSATATCPAGRRVVGGGVGAASNGAFANVVQVSGPVDETGSTENTNTGDVGRSWLASVKDDGSDRTYAVFALCSATSDATIAQSNISLAANAVKGSGDSTCPSGTRVVGGGVGTTGPTVGGQVALSGPLGQALTVPNTGDVARVWVASVANGGAAQTYKVFALCSASSDATIAEASFSFPGGAQTEGEAVARCPAGRRALGGGIITTASTVSSTVRRSAPQVGTGFATIQSALENGATVDTNVSRRWAASVVNADDARTYKVLALCVADEPPPGSPAPGSPGPLGPGTGSPDPSAPGLSEPLAALSGLRLSSTRFRAARSGSSVATRGGLGVSYALSAAASVRFTVERKSSGRRVGATCVGASRRNRKRPICVRYVPAAGSFTRTPASETDAFRFSGRLSGRTLSAGSYRLVAVPVSNGRKGTPARSAFTILKPR